ncbi:FMN-binding protein [Calidifontibacter indicus]|uniref:FMN-binding protein n=1 Tax=Calidifontibacter indicus TaxID=419650 RepID=A0A3D9UQ58_9MICO|nr:FMN-binding protein [Calidifontibacter indicus]REF30603.1 FMN-binding protein [Calidifontibacter indicus]
MKRITYWGMATVTVLVLLFSYRTSLHSDFAAASSQRTVQSSSVATGVSATGSGGGSGSGDGADTSTGSSTGSSGSAGSSSSASGSNSSASGTFTGDSVDTRWGPVQVQITVSSGKITAVQAVVYPTDNPRDVEINNQALPILADEAVKAQSSQIDTVSGATVTSDGYISSLQSAIDKANL